MTRCLTAEQRFNYSMSSSQKYFLLNLSLVKYALNMLDCVLSDSHSGVVSILSDFL